MTRDTTMRTLIFFLLGFCFSNLFSQKLEKSPIDFKEIDRYVLTAMTEWKIPGCAVAVVKGNELIYAKGYGYRNMEDRLPVTANTVFKIASCTKSFTAAAAGLLVERKLLDWDIPVKDYLPRLEFSSELLTRQVTLRDLLSHRTGLLDDDWSWVGDHIDSNRMFEILSVMPQQGQFRSDYLYANMTYALAGYLIGTRTKSSWRQIIRQYFFEPLSMNSTSFSHTENSGISDFAFGYEWVDSSAVYQRGNLNEHYTDSLSVCEPFAFISSSVADLSQWVRLFINGGSRNKKQLIPERSMKELLKPSMYEHASRYKELSESYYCMGWEQNYYKQHKLLQHSGGLAGFKSYMSFMPQDSIGIVVLTNGQAYRFPQALSYDLYDRLLGVQPTNWLNKFREEANKVKSSKTTGAGRRIAGTLPSRPLAEYAGVYFSKWLGTMKVFYENGSLYFQFHQYPKELMKHAHYDTFYTEPEWSLGSGISFRCNHDGKITGLLLNEFLLEKKDQ